MELLGILTILIAVPIVIRGYLRYNKQLASYEVWIKDMPDFALRREAIDLAQKNNKLPIVVRRNSANGRQAYDLKKKHLIVLSELKRRGIK